MSISAPLSFNRCDRSAPLPLQRSVRRGGRCSTDERHVASQKNLATQLEILCKQLNFVHEYYWCCWQSRFFSLPRPFSLHYPTACSSLARRPTTRAVRT